MSKENTKTGKYAVIAKFGSKTITILLKFFKIFKFGLLAAVAFTGYSYLFTWKFAILILLAVGWHEEGHVLAMKKLGFKEAKFIFLPFVGGASYSNNTWKSHWETVFIAIAGPASGFILAVITYILYLSTGYALFAAATSWICLMNLFNLFPISPFDGGHIARSISLSFHKTKGVIIFGCVSVIALYALIKLHIVLFVIFGIIGLVELVFSYFQQRRDNKYIEKINKVYDDRINSLKNGTYETAEDIQVYINEWEERRKEFNKTEKSSIEPMTTNQILISAIGYGCLVAALVFLIHLTSNIPGADLATNFMADK